MALSNKYPANCSNCGKRVPEFTGKLVRSDDNSKWVVSHFTKAECDNALAESDAPVRKVVANVKLSPATFPPTAEQQACIDLFATGESMVIEAGAGTGKTSTLRLLAHSADERGLSGYYLAFNKPIVLETKGTMPDNVTCSTAHALAYQFVKASGFPVQQRLANSDKMARREVARRLGLTPYPISYEFEGEVIERVLAPEYLAALVQRSVSEFCKTADAKITWRHVPYVDGIDEPGPRGKRHYENNRALAKALESSVQKYWKEAIRPEGQYPFEHEYYLKMWQLSHPKINTDFILFDEAQDANPVMAAVIAEQHHTQRVYVGDSQQSIYEFTGAVNALAQIETDNRLFLTQSFRFGQAIADAANIILAGLEAELKIKGFDKITSTVGVIDGEPDAILTRTNACAIDCILSAQERGVKAHLVGGGDEFVFFAKGARQLMDRGYTTHPELACFSSWNEVQTYVKDEDGADLKLNVDIVEKYTPETIITALTNMPKAEHAELVVSTAHKSKGKEWDSVLIAKDFAKPEPKKGEKPTPLTPAELRLRYVAVTRAKKQLDNTVFSTEDAA